MKKIFTPLILGALISAAFIGAPARAQIATEFTQHLNNGLLVQQLSSLQQQVATELNALRVLEQNLKQASGLVQGTEIVSRAKNIMGIYKQAQIIKGSLSEVDSQFRKSFPEYEKALAFQSPYTFGQKARQLQITTNQSLKNALTVGGVQMEAMESEQQFLSALTEKANSAQGQTEVLQVLTQMTATLNTDALQSRQLAIAAANSQATWIAAEEERRANEVLDRERHAKAMDEAKEKGRAEFGRVSNEFQNATSAQSFKKIQIQR